MAQVPSPRRRACEEAVFHPIAFSGIHCTIAGSWEINISHKHFSLHLPACSSCSEKKEHPGKAAIAPNHGPLGEINSSLCSMVEGPCIPHRQRGTSLYVSCHSSTLPAPHCRSSALDPLSAGPAGLDSCWGRTKRSNHLNMEKRTGVSRRGLGV